MRYEDHNLDGQGAKRTRVYDMPIVRPGEYWPSVTNVPCPAPACTGRVQWAEAGYVPGYRICDACGRHFYAKGNAAAPVLVQNGTHRSAVPERTEQA